LSSDSPWSLAGDWWRLGRRHPPALRRDRALLLLGFAGAFRRSEIVALDCEDIEECETGLRITIRRRLGP
jgi:integrase